MTITMVTDDDIDDYLVSIFIEETFAKNEPIREKPIQTIISKVWIKDKRPKKEVVQGVEVKIEPESRLTINDRFTQLGKLRQEAGIVFETDDINDDDEDFEDIEEEEEDEMTNEELNLGKSQSISRPNKRNITINLAKKLKKRSIANRLGIAYVPTNARRRLNNKVSIVKKSWSEKFGQLLAARKLLYLPLLNRKYNSGPKRTREELDVELDLYMAEVRERKAQLMANEISNAMNGNTNGLENGITIVDPKRVFGNRLKILKPKPKEEPEPEITKESLDMEIESYMGLKGESSVVSSNGSPDQVNRESLDMDLDSYMATVRRRNKNAIKT
ncbi:uncharacterized protein LOC128958737 [Oppia nitens]|uniref:uncharacterized protein LOC128958737 n=1 Tax=Oppia nitens TaxID=1686743 RepID=UPI0023DC5ED4|nr:uncharacterized protein LOC128958737 [Oppia nitens]